MSGTEKALGWQDFFKDLNWTEINKMPIKNLYFLGFQCVSLKLYGIQALSVIFCFLVFSDLRGQDSLGKESTSTKSTSTIGTKTVMAGPQYGKSSFHQWLWGKHYRKEWTTPVTIPIINLDSVDGGLTAYESGGGRQTKTLRLKNPAGREYVLRSIDKTFGKALPQIYEGTFVEKIINDQVSIAHPYSALTIPPLAKVAQIYHSDPSIVFVPQQKALGEFTSEFGNSLYLLEQRADGDWREAPNFGNSTEIVSTEKMLEKIFEESDHRIDQQAYIRARLFDMLIGDWGRHEDQWRWAKFDQDDKKIYKAIPRDRDQVYTKFDGLLVSSFKGALGGDHLQTFNNNIKDIGHYNFSARNLDRQAANETTFQQWISTARDIQQLVTDEVIETSVKRLPPELFSISGNEIIEKLKSRRNNLVDFARRYYSILAKEVEIVGTKSKEVFEVRRLSDTETQVNVYDINSEGEQKKQPFYSRTFLKHETRELRLYGLEDNDKYVMTGEASKGIDIRIIGGPSKDLYNDSLAAKWQGSIKIYDDKNNEFNTSQDVKLRLSESDSIHVFRYNGFNYNSKRLKKSLFYSNEDRIYIGLRYVVERQRWRKFPFDFRQEVNVKYSLMENAFSTEYRGNFTEVIGKWNLAIYGNYDWIRWNNYFGIGNETERIYTGKDYRDYYRMRTRELHTSIGINRNFGRFNHVAVSGFFQSYQIVSDTGRYVAHHPTNSNGSDYDLKSFAGAKLDYFFQKVDNPILPMKGIRFFSSVSYTADLKESNKSFARLFSALSVYLPLSRSFVYYLKTGGATLTGTPDFYQLNILGGGQTLRGYRRFRFYGKTVFFAQNELQWIRPVRGNLFNGKAGLLALSDLGRVWHPGEESNKLHMSFGGGFILSPFNRVSVAATYAVSKEDATINFRFGVTL
ncbi:MAG: hypothetical protein ACXWCG_04355 [Flavitalea sp.]